jgi:hypothetical protein
MTNPVRNSLPEALRRLVLAHGDEYAPHYPPIDNADHGPMTFLAMHGLGIDVTRIEQFAAQYRRKLITQGHSVGVVTESDWKQHIGHRESYRVLREFFAADIRSRGWERTVSRYLPLLVSGWVKDAFHPLIRLAYGIEFSIDAEIASGLAYLAITGDDPQLATVAARPPLHRDAPTYLELLQSWRTPSLAGNFNNRYQAASHVAALRPAGGSPEEVLKALSRAGMEIFDATHDFFALHLVTSSHAFRVCSPWAGPNWGAIFSTGIAIAYLAIGAPPFSQLQTGSAVLPLETLSTDNDEHDIKIAYTSLVQAKAFGDPAYEWVAARYLTARRHTST